MLATVLTKSVRDRWKSAVIGAVTLALLFLSKATAHPITQDPTRRRGRGQ